MPTIDFIQLAALPITELAIPEPLAKAGGGSGRDLFNDYLQRANTVPCPSTAEDWKAQPSPPPKAEQDRLPDERSKTVPPEKPAGGRAPASEASSQANEDSPDAPEKPSAAPTEMQEEQSKPGEAKQENSNEVEVKPSEKNTVQEKEDADNKKESKPDVEVSKNPENMTAMPVVQPWKNVDRDEAVADETSSETECVIAAKETEMPLDGSTAKKAGKVPVEAETALSKPTSLTQLIEQRLAEMGNQPDADNPADAALDASGKGKVKARKNREAAAEAKNVGRREKAVGENRMDAAARADTEPSAAMTEKGTGDGGKATPVLPQAAANAMQSVVEVLKNAEKPAMVEDAAGPVGDIRAGSSTKTIVGTAAEKNGAVSAPTGSDNAVGVQRAQFVQRVERAFAAMGHRDGSVRLKLSPPELGVLKLEIGIHKGVMKARVEAETPAAQSLLLDNLPELRERLAQQNIHIQQFDVDLMDRSPDGMPQHTFGQADSDSQQGTHHSPRAKMTADLAAGSKATATTVQRPGMGGSLNVFV